MAKATLLFIGTDDGVVLLTDPGGSGRWLRSGHELRGIGVRSVWANPRNPLLALALSESQLYQSIDGGFQWRELSAAPHSLGLYGGWPDRSRVYLPAGATLLASDTGGDHWHEYALPGECGAFACSEEGRLYCAIGAQVFSCNHNGVNWEEAYAPLPASVDEVVAGTGEIVFALAGGVVYGMEDGQWQAMPDAFGPGSAFTLLRGKLPTLLLARAAGGVARHEAGAWDATPPLLPWEEPLSALAAAGHHMDTAFAGSPTGMLAQSSDRGRTWTLVRQGLPNIRSISSARLA